MRTSTNTADIGFVVDAGPGLGYGHVVRCVRLASALSRRHEVLFYPLSVPCREFIQSFGFEIVALPNSQKYAGDWSFPPLVITDLREAHGITAAIHRNGSRHISIHDLGLAQCHSDVVIDGSITTLFPYSENKGQELFLGPQYMITRDAVRRHEREDTVLVTLGGGSTARSAVSLSDTLSRLGLHVISTEGLFGSTALSDTEFADAMSRCRFAISGSGVTLYDLLASGVPTIAVAFDLFQLRTAEAFHRMGAVMCAGLLERLSPAGLVQCCREMLENQFLVQRVTQAGQMLVDGKGLSRVVEIVRRQLWLTSQEKTFTAC